MSDWTFDTLKEYLDARVDHLMELKVHDLKSMAEKIEANARYVQEQFRSVHEAVIKAEQSTDKRLAVLNELRSVVSDQRGAFITRIEVESKIDSTVKDVGLLQGRLDKLEGRGSGLNAGWGYLVGAIGLALTVIEAIRTFK